MVRLEAEGLTASSAQGAYGYSDVWSLAKAYLPLAQAQTAIAAPEHEKRRRVRDYIKGAAFAAPLACCCLAVLLLKVSLWGGRLSGGEASATAIATITAFIASGGFIQLIGRQGHFHKQRGEWGHCYRTSSSLAQAGFLGLCCCGVAGWMANAYFELLPAPLLAWCTAFEVGIGSYLLMSAVLYVIDGELLLALATVLGTGVVVALHSRFGMPVLAAQIYGIVAATLSCVAFAAFRFQRLGAYKTKLPQLRFPGALLYKLSPYFAFGLAYYAFLFTDRIVAWSAGTGSAALPFQFRGDYETAADVCLFAFIVQVAWVHAALVGFYRLVNAEQKRWLFDARDELKRVLLRFYHKQLMVFGGLFVIAALASVTVIEQVRALREILDLRVALLGLLATPFLTVGLWNIALLFALSRPRFALVSIGWGVTLNLCAGYLLSRLFSYDLAIVGFDIGSGAVAFASGWFCWKLLPNFEYHYFAATA